MASCFVNHTAFEETGVDNTLTGKPGSCHFVHDCVHVRACNGSTDVTCIWCKMKGLVRTERNIKQIICHASGPGLLSPTGTYRCGVYPPFFAKSVKYLKILWQKKNGKQRKVHLSQKII